MFVHMFKTIVNLSISGAITVLFIIIIKHLLKGRVSPRWHYLIWIVLLIKLAVPISFSSYFSIYNVIPMDYVTIEQDITLDTENLNKPTLGIEKGFIENDFPKETSMIDNDNRLDGTQNVIKANGWQVVSYIWIAGSLLVFGWFSITKLLVRMKLKANKSNFVILEDLPIINYCKKITGVKDPIKVIETKNMETPFVFGVVRPWIVLPSCVLETSEEALIQHVLIHEMVHIKRRDNMIKHMFMLILGIHWFNPFVWYAFLRMNKDCEFSCDAEVLSLIGKDHKKGYASSLLSLASRHTKNNIGEQLLAFGQSDTKGRVKKIMSFKEYSRNSKILAIAIVFILAVTILTVGINNEKDQSNDIIREEARLGNGERYYDNDTQDKVEELLNKIISGGQPASNPYVYIDINKEAFDEIVSMDLKALNYMLDQLDHSNADGLREYIMAAACAQIMGVWDKDQGIGINSGREWYYKYGVDYSNPRTTTNTDYIAELDKKNLDSVVHNYILEYNKNRYYTGEIGFSAYKVYETKREGKNLVLFTVVQYYRLGFENDQFTVVSGSGAIPTVIKLKINENQEYEVVEYSEPRDGKESISFIRSLFPENIVDIMMENDEALVQELWKSLESQARAYLKYIDRDDVIIKPRVEKDTDDETLRAIYNVNLMKPGFPTWNGTKEILVRAGGPAPGMIVRATLETQATRINEGEYEVLLKRLWHTNINGQHPISWWKYRVKGSDVTFIDYEDHDGSILLIK